MAEIDGDWPEGFIVGQGEFDDFIHVFCALCLHDIALLGKPLTTRRPILDEIQKHIEAHHSAQDWLIGGYNKMSDVVQLQREADDLRKRFNQTIIIERDTTSARAKGIMERLARLEVDLLKATAKARML